jgi:hypothetical protein
MGALRPAYYLAVGADHPGAGALLDTGDQRLVAAFPAVQITARLILLPLFPVIELDRAAMGALHIHGRFLLCEGGCPGGAGASWGGGGRGAMPQPELLLELDLA